MFRDIQVRILPELAADQSSLEKAIRKQSGISGKLNWEIIRRSIDARQRQVMLQLTVRLYESEKPAKLDIHIQQYPSVSGKPEVFIVGCGPAGIFAALTCIKRGYKPVIIERGKDVKSRRRDLAAITRQQVVHPDSNYCFGEGGAGTYSDGKLYTRSDKRGNIKEVLETFVAFGANPDILIDAHPHIGTNKLPGIISSMRAYIIAHGGEVRFSSRVTGIYWKDGKMQSVEVNGTEKYPTNNLILATGHSARDIYFMLHSSGVELEFKPFAAGVRIEHPQMLIDSMQYHCEVRSEYLPPAAYNYVRQVEGRGVYSFCMCPGGIIAPCSTAQEEVVTNGWSPSKRNNPFANSGFVVGVEDADLHNFRHFGPLRGLAFQMALERKAWEAGGQTQAAPAQRMVDFVRQQVSASLPECSYKPGIVSADLREVLPSFIHEGLRGAFQQLQKIQPAYFTNEAVLVGVESRTSSPVRIPRDPVTLQHPQVQGLYPCGEGGGYAGGIVSAAMDGIRIANAVDIS
jgi:uncharacterized FAD-dependent dehydrogenase